MKTFEQLVEAEQRAFGESLMSRAEQLVKFKANQADLEAGLAALDKIQEDWEGPTHYLWGYIMGADLRVYISNLKSFSEVAPYLRAIRAALPHHELQDRKQLELEYEVRVGPFHLHFRVSHGEATCRKVQVGTEMKEVPVYEIQCDDGTPSVPQYDLSNNPANGGI